MKLFFGKYLVPLFFLLSCLDTVAQGSLCSTVEPFCAGSEELVFPNSNSNNSGQVTGEFGPNYGCLISQPYPAWFYLQVENAGDLNFTISQFQNVDGSGARLDVDYIVWGPFEPGEEYCNSSSLSFQNIVSCSYSPEPVERLSIPNANAGDIYVVLITNFSGFPGFISLQQTNAGQTGSGSTDCTILNSALGEDQIICGEDEFILDGTTENAALYEWFIFNETTRSYDLIPNENNPTLRVTQSGNYKLVVTDELGENSAEDDVNITFFDEPTAQTPGPLFGCVDPIQNIDLTENENLINSGNAGNNLDYEVEYYASSQDLERGNSIQNPENYPFQENQIILARLRHLESGCVSAPVQFELLSYQFPDYNLPETTFLCVDTNLNLQETQNIGRDLGEGFQYQWSASGNIITNNPFLIFNQTPNFSQLFLEITHIETGCKLELETEISLVSAPAEVSISIAGSDFENGYTVTATSEGGIGSEGTQYEYRLDNGPFQSSGVFTNVPPGSHRITAREVSGCGSTSSEEFQLIGYPRFFTPNSDGFNDNWQIIGNNQIDISNLYIFDRYGKLLKQLNPSGPGWDGVYKDTNMPADDYWFKIEYQDKTTGEPKIFSGNFTLKR